MAKGHPIESLGKVADAMREALDQGKRDIDVVRHVDKALREQPGKAGK